MVNQSILVIGGDRRYKEMAEKLREEGFDIETWGVPELENVTISLRDALRGKAVVVLPREPFLEGELRVGNAVIEAYDLKMLLPRDAILIAGYFPEEVEKWLQLSHFRCRSYQELEGYALRNAEITAEAAIMLGMEQLECTLKGAEILIVGCGRIGGFLAEKLKNLGAEVTVAVRRDRQEALLEIAGYRVIRLDRERGTLRDYELIYNTVPGQVFSEEELLTSRNNCVFVELASQPGGFPKELSQKRKTIAALGLPGKYAPKTAGIVLSETVKTCLHEGERWME